MPNFMTHFLLAKRLYMKAEYAYGLETAFDESFLKENIDYLYLGTQGPDPLFYVGILPFHGLHLWTAKKKIGNKLHKRDPRRFFRSLINQSYMIANDKEESVANQKRFQAFIFGQLLHYFLDREAHPYVLYKTGFDEKGKITGKYHYEHAHFEYEIDVLLARQSGIAGYLDRPMDIFPSGQEELSLVDKYFVPVLKEEFNQKRLPKKMYSNGLLNMRRLMGYMNRNPKFKAKLFGKSTLAAMALPVDSADEKVLNKDNATWLDPVSGEKNNASFSDIMANALDISLSCLDDIMKNGFHYDVIAKYLDGKDYYGLEPGTKWIYKEENYR